MYEFFIRFIHLQRGVTMYCFKVNIIKIFPYVNFFMILKVVY